MSSKQPYQFKSTCPIYKVLEILWYQAIYLCITDLYIISLYNLYYFYMLCFRFKCVHLRYSVMSTYNVLYHMSTSRCTNVIHVHIIAHIYNNG